MQKSFIPPEIRYGKKLAEYASFFRSLALEIDENPDSILAHCNTAAVQFLVTDRTSTTLERTIYLEALSYGDPGVMLACPGPSLSGLLLRELANSTQCDAFYDYIVKENARTFFALTEPAVGSNAGNMTCQLRSDSTSASSSNYLLSGEKCLFGNGADGKIGIVLARLHPGPLGICPILITPQHFQDNAGKVERTRLAMTGLRGAQIAAMRFHEFRLSANEILGQHLRVAERGMLAILKTFNRLRTGVGALAIGQAQAVLDYGLFHPCVETSCFNREYQDLNCQLQGVRDLLRGAAAEIDKDPYQAASVSVAKAEATRLAEKVITQTINHLPVTALLENPWLAKCYRDCFAWEYMEGSSIMQYKTVYSKLQRQWQDSYHAA